MSKEGISCVIPRLEWFFSGENKNELEIFTRMDSDGHQLRLNDYNMENFNWRVYQPPMTPALKANGATPYHYGASQRFHAKIICRDQFDKLNVWALGKLNDLLIKVNDRTGTICPVWCFPKDFEVAELFPGELKTVKNKAELVTSVKVWQPSQDYESKEFSLELLKQIESGNIKPIKGVIYPTDSCLLEDYGKPYRQKDNYYYVYNKEVYLMQQVYFGDDIINKNLEYNIGDYMARKVIEQDMYIQQYEDYMYATSLDFLTRIRPMDAQLFLEGPYVNNFLKLQEIMRRYKETGDIETGDIETGDIETGDVETGDIETGDVETGNIETGDIETRDVPTEQVDQKVLELARRFNNLCLTNKQIDELIELFELFGKEPRIEDEGRGYE